MSGNHSQSKSNIEDLSQPLEIRVKSDSGGFFMKLSETYEAEQTDLKDRITKLQAFIDHEQEAAVNTDSFIRLVKKHTDVQELNAEIIREFVDKIYIYKAERIGGKKGQHIKILWNCIG